MRADQMDELPELKKESEKLLHVAELLEADAYLYKVDEDDWHCWRCEMYARRSRLFRAMATRIRRFWGSAFQHIPSEELHDTIRDGIATLNLRKVGQSYRCLSTPMQTLSVIREVLALRVENEELSKRLAEPSPDIHFSVAGMDYSTVRRDSTALPKLQPLWKRAWCGLRGHGGITPIPGPSLLYMRDWFCKRCGARVVT